MQVFQQIMQVAARRQSCFYSLIFFLYMSRTGHVKNTIFIYKHFQKLFERQSNRLAPEYINAFVQCDSTMFGIYEFVWTCSKKMCFLARRSCPGLIAATGLIVFLCYAVIDSLDYRRIPTGTQRQTKLGGQSITDAGATAQHSCWLAFPGKACVCVFVLGESVRHLMLKYVFYMILKIKVQSQSQVITC